MSDYLYEKWKQIPPTKNLHILPWERSDHPDIHKDRPEEILAYIRATRPLVERGIWWYRAMLPVRMAKKIISIVFSVLVFIFFFLVDIVSWLWKHRVRTGIFASISIFFLLIASYFDEKEEFIAEVEKNDAIANTHGWMFGFCIKTLEKECEIEVNSRGVLEEEDVSMSHVLFCEQHIIDQCHALHAKVGGTLLTRQDYRALPAKSTDTDAELSIQDRNQTIDIDTYTEDDPILYISRWLKPYSVGNEDFGMHQRWGRTYINSENYYDREWDEETWSNPNPHIRRLHMLIDDHKQYRNEAKRLQIYSRRHGFDIPSLRPPYFKEQIERVQELKTIHSNSFIHVMDLDRLLAGTNTTVSTSGFLSEDFIAPLQELIELVKKREEFSNKAEAMDITLEVPSDIKIQGERKLFTKEFMKTSDYRYSDYSSTKDLSSIGTYISEYNKEYVRILQYEYCTQTLPQQYPQLSQASIDQCISGTYQTIVPNWELNTISKTIRDVMGGRSRKQISNGDCTSALPLLSTLGVFDNTLTQRNDIRSHLLSSSRCLMDEKKYPYTTIEAIVRSGETSYLSSDLFGYIDKGERKTGFRRMYFSNEDAAGKLSNLLWKAGFQRHAQKILDVFYKELPNLKEIRSEYYSPGSDWRAAQKRFSNEELCASGHPNCISYLVQEDDFSTLTRIIERDLWTKSTDDRYEILRNLHNGLRDDVVYYNRFDIALNFITDAIEKSEHNDLYSDFLRTRYSSFNIKGLPNNWIQSIDDVTWAKENQKWVAYCSKSNRASWCDELFLLIAKNALYAGNTKQAKAFFSKMTSIPEDNPFYPIVQARFASTKTLKQGGTFADILELVRRNQKQAAEALYKSGTFDETVQPILRLVLGQLDIVQKRESITQLFLALGVAQTLERYKRIHPSSLYKDLLFFSQQDRFSKRDQDLMRSFVLKRTSFTFKPCQEKELDTDCAIEWLSFLMEKQRYRQAFYLYDQYSAQYNNGVFSGTKSLFDVQFLWALHLSLKKNTILRPDIGLLPYKTQTKEAVVYNNWADWKAVDEFAWSANAVIGEEELPRNIQKEISAFGLNTEIFPSCVRNGIQIGYNQSYVDTIRTAIQNWNRDQKLREKLIAFGGDPNQGNTKWFGSRVVWKGECTIELPIETLSETDFAQRKKELDDLIQYQSQIKSIMKKGKKLNVAINITPPYSKETLEEWEQKLRAVEQHNQDVLILKKQLRTLGVQTHSNIESSQDVQDVRSSIEEKKELITRFQTLRKQSKKIGYSLPQKPFLEEITEENIAIHERQLPYTSNVRRKMKQLRWSRVSSGSFSFLDQTFTISSSFQMMSTELPTDIFDAMNGHESNTKHPKLFSYSEVKSFLSQLARFMGDKKCANTLLECTDNSYRLPTMQEWKYAALAKQNHYFAGSNISDEVAWHASNSGTLMPIGLKKKNRWGFFDMSGNAPEWAMENNIPKVFGGGYDSEPKNVSIFATGNAEGIGTLRLVQSK